jgi:hypothetical protein
MRAGLETVGGHRWLLFDIGGTVGIDGLLLAFVRSAISNGVALFKEERLP